MDSQESNHAAQLRQLRLILGKDFKPLDGEEFARLAGMAPGTLRATEAGLRKLNQRDTDRIRHRIGAVWNDKKETWVLRDDDDILFSREVYDKYVALLWNDPSNLEVDAELLYQGVFDLLSSLPKGTYHHALFELHDLLEKLARDFEAPAAVLDQLTALRPVVTAGIKGAKGEVELRSIDYPDIDKIKRPAPLLDSGERVGAFIEATTQTSEQLFRRLKGKRSKTRSQTPS
jgi:transcriptional regulator with XRE-family HTH domain